MKYVVFSNKYDKICVRPICVKLQNIAMRN